MIILEEPLSGVITRILINLSFCLLTSVSLAQNAKYFYKIAEEYFYGENHEEALYYFKEASKKSSNYLDVRYKIEMCLLLSGNQDRPLDKILAYRDTYGKEDKFYYYFLGKILDYRYQFDEAITAWNQFLKIDAYKSKEIIEETNAFIAQAMLKKEFINTTSAYQVSPIDRKINTERPQLSPVFIPSLNRFIFVSIGKPPEELLSLYEIKKNGDSWSLPSSIESLKSFQSDIENFGIANGGQDIYILRDKSFLTSKRSGDTWGKLQEWDNKPGKMKSMVYCYFSNDGNRIIYSSDENYKKSGLDLYEITKGKSGKWSKPKLLSNVINTELDERNVTLAEDGNTLYFSSNGHNSIGGYDIFRSQYNTESKTWSKPENLGYPINTPDNEIDFQLSQDGEFGFLSSNRNKARNDYDIYYVHKSKNINIRGTIFDMVTRNELSDLTIEFVVNDISKQTFHTTSDGTGTYSTNLLSNSSYQVKISEGQEVLLTDVLNIPKSIGDSVVVKDFYVEQFKVSEDGKPVQEIVSEEVRNSDTPSLSETEKKAISKIAEDDPGRYKQYERTTTELSNLGSKYRRAQKAILDNIYFDFGTAQLTRESLTVLDELLFTLNYYPSLEIVIAGHTDNIGPADANQWLSENRAKAVKDFLVAMEVSEERIQTVGLGDSEPIATNEKEKNGRELNRRIEVLVKE